MTWEQCASERQGFATARNRGSVAQMSRLHCDLLAWSFIQDKSRSLVFCFTDTSLPVS